MDAAFQTAPQPEPERGPLRAVAARAVAARRPVPDDRPGDQRARRRRSTTPRVPKHRPHARRYAARADLRPLPDDHVAAVPAVRLGARHVHERARDGRARAPSSPGRWTSSKPSGPIPTARAQLERSSVPPRPGVEQRGARRAARDGQRHHPGAARRHEPRPVLPGARPRARAEHARRAAGSHPEGGRRGARRSSGGSRGRAYARGAAHEDCSAELDPNQVLAVALQNLVTPMTQPSGAAGRDAAPGDHRTRSPT